VIVGSWIYNYLYNQCLSNPIHGEVYSIQHYVIKFLSDLQQVGGFLRGTPGITEILLEVALNTINQTKTNLHHFRVISCIYTGPWCIQTLKCLLTPGCRIILLFFPAFYLFESIKLKCHQIRKCQYLNCNSGYFLYRKKNDCEHES
jgi:hypothetical protein